jgi:hypothetical protein
MYERDSQVLFQSQRHERRIAAQQRQKTSKKVVIIQDDEDSNSLEETFDLVENQEQDEDWRQYLSDSRTA